MMKLHGFGIVLLLEIFMHSLLYSNDICIVIIKFNETCHVIDVDIEPVYGIYVGIIEWSYDLKSL